MMSRKNINQSHIEIRSEKVRRIIGANPPKFVSWGIIVIMLLYVALFVFVLSLPYPYGGGETIFQHLFWI